MLRISLIGAGDIKGHYSGILKLSRKKVEKEMNNLAKVLADSRYEIVALPDRGMPFEITKKYKQFGGKKAYGTVPLNDKDFGIGHMKQYIESKINGKKVFDEIINTDNWYKQDMTCCLYANAILLLGLSTGSLGELSYAYYLYKIFKGYKSGVKTNGKQIHPEIRAGETIPYITFVYKPFVKGKLPYELEEYIKKFGGKVIYINNSEELRKSLKKLAE